MTPPVASHASILLGFRAENVRSFREEFEISLLATARAEEEVVRLVKWRMGGHPLGVLPVAAIFGANASGKSNALRAINDMRTCVVASFRQERKRIPRSPFRLDRESAEAPSRFRIDLVLNGVRHEYGFAVTDEEFTEEWAIRYPKGRPAVIFQREGGEVHVGSTERGDTRSIERLLRPNALLLSAAGAAPHPGLTPLFEWFRNNLMLAESANRDTRQAFTTRMLDSDKDRERALALLRAADLGLLDARRQEVDPLDKERLARALTVYFEDDELEVADVAPEDAIDMFAAGVTLTHKAATGEIELPPSEESLGTIVWLGLVGPVIDALTKGNVLLADELDASLHPALVAQLVRLFQDPLTNPNRAQLIFNSHDATVLGDSSDERLVGRDQTWFTEKFEDGRSRLYPLADFNPRKQEAIARRYLAGRYGATPLLSRSQFEQIGDLVASDD